MGFGGLRAARALAGKGVQVLVIDRRNYHLFQPLLYQVATASLPQEYIAYPARGVLRKWEGIDFRLGEVTGVDLDQRIVHLKDGEVSYDYLVLAAGSVTHFFGMKDIEEQAFDLKCLDRTVQLRNHILERFERGTRETDPEKRRALLTFVVVGGGPAGVEFAGSLRELIRHELCKDHPGLDPEESRIVLLEAGNALLPFLPEKHQAYTKEKLREMGVEVHLNTKVCGAETGRVLLADGTSIPSHTLVWSAGVQAAPLAAALDITKRAHGRIVVEPDLSVPGHPEVFVIGDMAYLKQDGAPLPMVAQVAMQGGEYAGKAILARITGLPAAGPFRYWDKGNMAIIGRNAAAVSAFGINFSGFFAWLLWLGLHLVYLAGLRYRTIVLINWICNYLFRSQQIRIISGSAPSAGSVFLAPPDAVTNAQAG